MSWNFENDYVKIHCTLRNDGMLFIEGTLKRDGERVLMYAANPIQRMTNYSGSALPYPSADVAFDRTPNEYTVDDTSFNTVFMYPNAYYMRDTLVPPSIFFEHDKVLFTFPLPNPFPLRTLTYRPELNSSAAYNRRQELGVMSQDKLIKVLSEPQPYLY